MIFGMTEGRVRWLHDHHIRHCGPIPESWYEDKLYAFEAHLRRWALSLNLLERSMDMTVNEMHEALGKMIEAGHGDAVVSHVNGTGKATRLTGWELMTMSAYVPEHGAAQSPDEKQLKLYTTSKF